MPRRAVTFAIAAVLVFGLVFGGALLPVPYVALLPGPTKNVLGQSGDKPLITIDGHKTYPAHGHLNLVTVMYRGGPSIHMDLFTALRGWVDPDVAVVPEETLFPEGKSAEEVEQVTSAKMRRSQESATMAALRQMDIPVREKITVQEVMGGYPADGVLRAGDVLLAVEGEPIDSAAGAAEKISSTDPGNEVGLTIKRDGRREQLDVPTTAAKETPAATGEDPADPADPADPGDSGQNHAVVGVLLLTGYTSPVEVSIQIDEIGGPSAGMMFALGIVDKLTAGDLTGGEFVAGTGTITPEGKVGPIGGIAQKLAGAHSDGATVFLAPARNCAEARQSVPDGMRLVKVRTLEGALDALRSLKTGKGEVPRC